MRTAQRRPAARSGERGHLLVGLVVLLACMMIMLTAAAQSWTFLVRRDREAELIQRGEEYANAIKFYQKEVGSFPLKLELLAQKGPHGHRFIRKLYKDPLAEDGEWGLLYLSPTGNGFINPYATQLGEGFIGGDLPGQDPLAGGLGIGVGGNPFGQPGQGGFGNQKSGGFGSHNKNKSKNKDKEKKPGYSEMDQESLKNFEVSNMPIVGVVHKQQEWGVKVYKGQSSLNDWAFTLIGEGQQNTQGGGKRQAPAPRGGRRQGIGDSHNPIFLPGMLPPKPKGKNLVDQMKDDLQKWREDQEEKKAEEEAIIEDVQNYEEGEDEDPNAVEEGEDEDPNASGADEDPNGSGEEGGDDEDPNADPNGNGG